jgi:two-component system sensor histidine kinase HydH
MALPLLMLTNALLMFRELEQARGAFLRNTAAELAARLEHIPPGQLLEEEPAILDLKTYGPDDGAAEPRIRPILDGQQLFILENPTQNSFRAWVPYHADGITRIARLDLNPAAADFLTARPRQNLFLAVAASLVLAALLLYVQMAQRRQAELTRLAELGQMSAVLAHEIRNPLGALKGFLQLAHELSSGDAKLWLDESIEQTSRLERLVRDLLLYARTPQVKPQPVRWREMEHRLRPHVPGVEFPSSDFSWNTDPDLLEQVLLNLLRNAREAGTEVRIEAEPGRIRIFDNGPGLPPEVRAKLFQPFCTTKAQGTGLGLAIARNLTSALGGRLSLRDHTPSGTCAEIQWGVRA